MAHFQCHFVGFASLEDEPLFRHGFVCKLPPAAWGMQEVPSDALRMQGVHQRGQLAVLEAGSVWGDVPGPHYCLGVAPGASSGGTTWSPDDASELGLLSPLGPA